MRAGLVVGAIAAAAVMGGCDQASSLLPPGPRCGATGAALCDRVATLAISRMNLTATGPVTEVTLESVDCARTGKANFHAEWANAEACWNVSVTGERSHGGGLVLLWPDGDLEATW